MRVAYGDSNVLRCSIQFAYDRFFHTHNYKDITKQVVNTSSGIVNTKEQKDQIESTLKERGGQGGLPLGATTSRQGGAY